MEGRLDLDRAAALIAERVESWAARDIVVGTPTWRDQALTWPHQLVADRALAAEPDSVGIEVRLGAAAGRVVLFAGGWVDVEFWDGSPESEPVISVVGYDEPLTQDGVAGVLDRFAALFG